MDTSRLTGTLGSNITRRAYIIAGCGGIGSWVAYLLGLSGARALFLYDSDVVSPSNRTRSPFRECDDGRPKVEALREIITSNRAGVTVVPFQIQVSSETLFPITSIAAVFNCVDSLASERGVWAAVESAGLTKKYFRLAYDHEQSLVTGQGPDGVFDLATEETGYEVESAWAGPAITSAVMGILSHLGAFPCPRLPEQEMVIFDPGKLHDLYGGKQVVFLPDRARAYYKAASHRVYLDSIAQAMKVHSGTAKYWLDKLVKHKLLRLVGVDEYRRTRRVIERIQF
jgi:hypothetical protein